MLKADFLKTKFDAAHTYDDYLATGKPAQQESWTKIYSQISLTGAQKKLVSGFSRDMKVLASSGIWCGDCAQQCPLIVHIAEASPRISLRFVDRDEHADLAERIRLNAGARVPVVVFMAEDHEFVCLYGDRTLTRYRAIAQRQLGAACPLPGAPVPTEELSATMQDWLNEFERVQLMLRLSPRLREKHGD
ncbi:MAG: thiol reductase thioredoxin [Phycisphaeraceae bacterium]|nr:MAG: thiol reductase thioredoxin [Phycisphaeraceae bacterium]